MYGAFFVSEEERKTRMCRMQHRVQRNNFYYGGVRIFEELDLMLTVREPG
jgi:hypothetical protein